MSHCFASRNWVRDCEQEELAIVRMLVKWLCSGHHNPERLNRSGRCWNVSQHVNIRLIKQPQDTLSRSHSVV